MVEVIPGEDKKLIHLKCQGVLSHKDYQKVVIPTLEKAIANHGPLSVFCDLRDVQEIEGKAIWDDYKFGIHHLKDFTRLVTVGDQWWMGPLMSISRPFFNIEFKHFESEKYDDAWKWINQKK